MNPLNLEHPILYGNAAELLSTFLDKGEYSSVYLLVDENTRLYCLPKLAVSLAKFDPQVLEISSGERHKTLTSCQKLWETLLNHRADRKSLLINLGGGVIGDLGGFSACCYKRGIPFLQVPTTLLSQVDASVGGKLGVDYKKLKNVIGCFGQPEAVIIDNEFLQTLPPRQLLSGWVEMLKHALLDSEDHLNQLFDFDIKNELPSLQMIQKSIAVKKKIVDKDPYESGLRKALNLGHTLGHAIETLSLKQASPLLHGEAVAIGLVCALYLSQKPFNPHSPLVDKMFSYVREHYEPFKLWESDFDDIITNVLNDKKNLGGHINFVLLNAIGSVQIDQEVQIEDILKSLRFYNNSWGHSK